MNAPLRLKPGTWAAQSMTPEAAADFVKEAPNRAEEVLRIAASFRRMGVWVGAAGLAAGLVLCSSGAYMMTRAPEPAKMQFGIIDSLNGSVVATVAAADAPKLFSDDTARQYLRMFVENCDGYLRDNVRNMLRRCTALMDESMQTRYRDYFRAGTPGSPQNRYNPVSASAWPEGFRYAKTPSTGRVQTWNVYYTRSVLQNGQVVAREPMAATIHFEWRPDMAMTDLARTDNTAGFQATGYSFDKDPGR